MSKAEHTKFLKPSSAEMVNLGEWAPEKRKSQTENANLKIIKEVNKGSFAYFFVKKQVDRVSEQRLTCGLDFVQLSGEDSTALGFNAHGGHGCISVTSNVAPALGAEFQAACAAGDFAKARTIQDRLMPLHNALFIEPNPTGAKYALSLLGKMDNRLREPLVPIESSTEETIRAAMVHAGLLN